MPMVVPKHDHCDSIPLEEGSQRSHSISPDRSIEANKHRKDSLNTTEFGNLSMLFLLYFSQGIPAGLAGATIPTILKRFLPYGEVGMFTLTVYPHCLKLIWGPIVDFYWSGRVGRRLTWILPTQLLMGLAMVAIGVWTTFYFSEIERSAKTSQGLLYVLAWVLVSTLSAIQSCVTDGWGAHTLGSISGAFTAYSLFMFVYEPKLSVPDQAASALGNFVSHWGVFYLATGALLPLLKQEDAESKDVKRSIISAYQAIVSILRLRPIQRTVLVHLLARLAFEVNDGATDLKLLDKGFGNANLAMLVLIIMPFDLASAHLGGVFSKKYQPLRVWSVTYSIRLFSVVIAALVVALGPDGPPSSFYIFVVFIQRMFSVTSATVMFTTFLNFHLRVADPVVAGTYMTILAT
ncbi:hypothetical protein N7516_000166 [Penicillium verrucosum]|uniref:uncharacterized protein n=1 Tax=Penicillium verrucosum TaxID=60171 RepID=UPI0025458433|nr:uncharacterized protein N7516_000166 [Penicillium verrucosum]KAJ5939998.1 hypothetical protein N7516_000166 [Penicillium verrucosum]